MASVDLNGKLYDENTGIYAAPKDQFFEYLKREILKDANGTASYYTLWYHMGQFTNLTRAKYHPFYKGQETLDRVWRDPEVRAVLELCQ